MATKKSLEHVKIKNVGILFELLVRQIASDMMEGVSNPPSVTLMRKYFNPSREMGKELQLYRSFFDMNKLSESKAINFIDLIVEKRKRINERKLANEKYDFIKELKNSYDLKEFLSVKIPSYKTYASVYKTFLAETTGIDYYNVQDIAMARFTLVEQLSNDQPSIKKRSDDVIFESLKSETEDLRLLTLKLMIERYNDKYQHMNSRQKKLLKEYVNGVSKSKEFTKYVHSEAESVAKQISEQIKKSGSKILQIKLAEVVKYLKGYLEKNNINEHDLTGLMIAYQLVDELK